MKKIIGWILVVPFILVLLYFAMSSVNRLIISEPLAIAVVLTIAMAAVGGYLLYRAYCVGPEIQEGVWVVWNDGDRHVCCNCGDTHIVSMRIRGGQVEMMWQHDPDATVKEQRKRSRQESRQ